MKKIFVILFITVVTLHGLDSSAQEKCNEMIKPKVVVNVRGIKFKFSNTKRSVENLRLSINSLLILMSQEESKFNQVFQDQKVLELQKHFSGSKDKFYRKIREVRAIAPEVPTVKTKKNKNKIKRVKRSTVNGQQAVKFWTNTAFLSSAYEIWGGRLATGHGDGTVSIWERSGDLYNEVAVLEGHKAFVTAVIGVKGGHLATASRDKTVRIWAPDGDSYKQVKVLKHKDPVESIVELRDSSLVTGSSASAVNVWVPKIGVFQKKWEGSYKKVSVITGAHLESARSIVEVHTDWLAKVSLDGVVSIWTQGGAHRLVTILGKTGNTVTQLSDARLATGSSDGSIRIWNWNNMSAYDEVATIEGHKSSVTSIIELKNRQIATGAANGTVRIWHPDGESYKEAAVFKANQSKVNDIIELADGGLLVAFDDNTIIVWELDYGEEGL